jgi:RNA polymerase sigma-70 factor, ECF subfamily
VTRNASSLEPLSDSATTTLGSVLYAGQGKSPVSETVWVELLRSIAAGDHAAFANLYGRTHRLVFTLIMRIVANRESAEELTLDVFHDVWRRAGEYKEEGGPVLGWIMNQARSRAIDRVRFEQRKKRVVPHTDDPSAALAGGASIGSEELIAREQQGRRLRQAMTVLTADERHAIAIAFFSDCTYAEVASRLSEPVGTVKTRIRSAMSKLRLALEKEEAAR